jgi:hypothetical protein
MPGLDPGIHEALLQQQPYGCRLRHINMDCRVKPGNDEREAASSKACLNDFVSAISAALLC